MRLRITSLVLLLVAPVALFAQENVFNRGLRIGLSGEDVRNLQKVLNMDPSTRVASSGPGSFGNETNYFGHATQNALIRFQEKYKEEILIPVGLEKGSGFLGENSRAKAEKLFLKLNDTTSATTKTAPSSTPTADADVYVKAPSLYYGKPGTEITISGFGFTDTNNTALFGSYAVPGLPATGNTQILLTIPQIPKGVYPLSVTNAHGNSKSKTFFVVIDGSGALPQINSIEPANAAPGDTIVIKGSGFLKIHNRVQTSFKTYEDVSSDDGVTLVLPALGDVFSGALSPTKEKFPVKMGAYVVNENGVSNVGNFTLNI